MRLSVKFSLIISGLLFLAIVLMVFININQNKTFLQNEIRKKGQTLAQTASIACLDPLLKKDYATLRRYCNSIARDEDVTAIAILDPKYIVKMNNNINILGKSWQSKMFIPCNYYVMTHSITLADTVIGYVYISMSDRNIKEELRLLILKNVLLGAGFTLVGLGFALFMAKRITTPLNALIGYAARVAEGDFDMMPDSSSSDEVGVLSRAFNLMIANLKRYIEARTRNERLTMAGRLSSVIAHEIRNPLEPIKGAVTMLRMKNPDDPWVKKYTTIIEEEVGELSDFIGNFLDFTGTSEPALKKMNINTLILGVKDLTEEYIKQHNNLLVLILDPSLPDSFFDPKQMKQVVMNLILNSVQAMEERKGILEIETGITISDSGGRSILIRIKDNGMGIRTEMLKKLFDPYFTSKREGTGLGLFISQLLIEKHNGRLHIESEYGKWTMVLIKIPLKEKQDES